MCRRSGGGWQALERQTQTSPRQCKPPTHACAALNLVLLCVDLFCLPSHLLGQGLLHHVALLDRFAEMILPLHYNAIERVAAVPLKFFVDKRLGIIGVYPLIAVGEHREAWQDSGDRFRIAACGDDEIKWPHMAR